ncbi:anthraniloyl-CoA monooxygenase [Herbihabitans rhizosphaerae]|uniref:Anthraniloyl-CoA monooxygenase n=1 Tax=Herbihabitans rhizosphaerae TaxID=1872711 RepID=A0A4Q7L3N0_9PSEU|nr:FAD-dependent monooxygenase [Herbihabitans rhizosphaerae]RZS43794.1 anthraniloyl-CoA monooxygenase [Herbihabitans rhizosphaerae]
MKVTIVGAGPAGLYLGILLRTADPANEITILERNAPDATFGWGVVFSEETLGALRDADYPTYLEITDTFARWDAIDIHYQGESLRSRGHGFSAIARRRLLAILQRRCAELDVVLRFGVEVDDVAALAAETDVLVGADGVNSVVRRADESTFGASVTPQGCKYVWFGTDLVLDAFTFIFRETEHGLFQVHAYPFDENTSTFIVECPEHVWRRAGLDTMTEQESIAFCQDLFADELGGHTLMSNKSVWLDFPLVRNRLWHSANQAGNTVLIGDAAHTAHFTIGSGTKLAMEDSIVLAQAFVRHPASIESALVDYELERSPTVERFQQAAGQSAEYFRRVGRHTHLEPVRFAFNLLTRSGRITHASLSVRDPKTVATLDSSFAGGRAVTPPPMFAPLELRDVRLTNRAVHQVSTVDKIAGAADTGVGLVLVGPVAVSAEGRITPESSTVDSLRPTTGATVGVLLSHAGRRGATRPPTQGVDLPLPADQAWPLLAPSTLPYTPGSAVPKAMDADDMASVRTAFADAARKAAAAGLDLALLDLAQGHLLASFLSPLTNKRDDEYGGSPEARLRYPLEVLAAVREVWPEDRPLGIRLTVADWARGGLTEDDGVSMAERFAEAGVDLIQISAGHTVPNSQPEYRRGYLTALADRVRNEARVTTLVGGYLTTADEVNTIIGAGRADLCVLEGPC